MKCFCQRNYMSHVVFFFPLLHIWRSLPRSNVKNWLYQTDTISVLWKRAEERFEKSRRLFYPLWHLHPDPIWLWGDPVWRGDLSWVAAWEKYLFWIWYICRNTILILPFALIHTQLHCSTLASVAINRSCKCSTNNKLGLDPWQLALVGCSPNSKCNVINLSHTRQQPDTASDKQDKNVFKSL